MEKTSPGPSPRPKESTSPERSTAHGVALSSPDLRTATSYHDSPGSTSLRFTVRCRAVMRLEPSRGSAGPGKVVRLVTISLELFADHLEGDGAGVALARQHPGQPADRRLAGQ